MDKTAYINIFASLADAKTWTDTMSEDGFDVHTIGPTPRVAIERVYGSPPPATINTPAGGSYFVVLAANKG